jgi:PBP1b-binding outer membrane lipoprotein LpoB
MTKLLTIILTATFLQGCATAVAVVDVTASTAIYAGKTVVNTIDAVTPDIVN